MRLAFTSVPLILALCLASAGCSAEVRQASLKATDTGGAELPAAPPLALCGTLALPRAWPGGGPSGGTPLGGLSALAWDDDEALLYLVSDRGRLHRARPVFVDGTLTDLVPIATRRLRDTRGKPLTGRAADAESLLLENHDDGRPDNTRLLIGFEHDHRLQRFTRDGWPLGAPLHPGGAKGAEANRGMEAMARHSTEGPVIGLEAPPAGGPDGMTRLFTAEGDRHWDYPLAAHAGSALTELAPYGDDLLALERAFAPPAPLVISLSRVELLVPPATRVTRLVSLSSGDGWWLDNMEGLARLPDGRYLMVSDDNFSALQRTLLSCLALPRPAA